jgi:hypothetical protein
MRWHAQHGKFILGFPKFSQRFVPLFLWNNLEWFGTTFDQNLLLLWLFSVNRRRKGNRIISVFWSGRWESNPRPKLGTFVTAAREPLKN